MARAPLQPLLQRCKLCCLYLVNEPIGDAVKMDQATHNKIVSFKRGKYPDVILPISAIEGETAGLPSEIVKGAL